MTTVKLPSASARIAAPDAEAAAGPQAVGSAEIAAIARVEAYLARRFVEQAEIGLPLALLVAEREFVYFTFPNGEEREASDIDEPRGAVEAAAERFDVQTYNDERGQTVRAFGRVIPVGDSWIALFAENESVARSYLERAGYALRHGELVDMRQPGAKEAFAPLPEVRQRLPSVDMDPAMAARREFAERDRPRLEAEVQKIGKAAADLLQRRAGKDAEDLLIFTSMPGLLTLPNGRKLKSSGDRASLDAVRVAAQQFETKTTQDAQGEDVLTFARVFSLGKNWFALFAKTDAAARQHLMDLGYMVDNETLIPLE